MKACVFGDASLTIQCIELLLSMGHDVLCLVSDKKNMQGWAGAHHINYCRNVEEFKLKVNPKSFDYLFSIVNFTILDHALLHMPKYFSINYHDSLLPHYAGVHASAWAILNGEKKHGVTWHVMDNKIDEGPVLIQSEFEIPEKATTYLVNMLGYEQAIKTFRTLLLALEAGNMTPTPQTSGAKTYFGLHQKPRHFGFISWDQPVDEIDRLFRAAQFGSHDNTFYLPKIILDQKTIGVPTALAIEKKPFSERGACGKVVQLNKTSVEIAAQDGKIILTEIKDLNNRSWLAGEWFMHAGIEKGNNLIILDKNFFTLLGPLLLRANNDEKKIVEKLSAKGGSNISFHLTKQDISEGMVTCALYGKNIYKVTEKYGYEIVTVFLAAIMIYIYKTNQYQNQLVIFENHDAENNSSINLFSHFFPHKRILEITLNPHLTFTEVAEKIIQANQKQPGDYCFTADMRLRYPSIDHHTFSFIISTNVQKNSLDFSSHPFVLFNPKACEITFSNVNQENTEAYHLFYKINERIDKIIQASLNGNSPLCSYHLLCPSDIHFVKNKNLKIDQHSHDKTDGSMVDFFDKIVKKFPHRIAIKSDSHKITYQELYRYATVIAKALLKNKEGQQHLRVVIHLDRGSDFIASIIGALKADCTYIPIDISQPLERIQYIVQDIKPAIIITREAHLCPVFQPYNLLNLDTLDRHFLTAEEDLLLFTPRRNEIAYIIYTSGTTGRPKGVQVTHHNLKSLFSSAEQHFSFSEKDTWVLLHSLSFDFSVWEMWGALIYGGQLVIASQFITQSPKDFLTWICQEHITVLNQTPSYFNQLMQYAENKIVSKDLDQLKIRYIIFGGEKLNVSPLKIWFKLQGMDKSKLVNMYGITETTVHASYQQINPHHLPENFVSIGTPLESLEFYVLDEYQQLVQPGLTGELYIAGEGVSAGYWNNTVETQKKFLTLRVLDQEKRAYKTGDYVILRQEGRYDYQGRIDSQVKIRGYRVELSEIDSVLERQENVKKSYTLVKKYPDDLVKKIITYVCVEKITQRTAAKLKKMLSFTLPRYMIPDHIVVLKEFPLTSNGKMNAALLPDPAKQKMVVSLGEGSHHTVRKIIMNIWESIFETNNISIEDNFFDLGGNSLLLSRMILKIVKIFQKDIPVFDFMNHPTISTLEKIMKASDRDQACTTAYPFLNAISFDKKIVQRSMPERSYAPIDRCHIFFTGATSFLGMYLLRALSRVTQGTLYVLLRGVDLNVSFEGLSHTYFQLHGEKIPANIMAVSGDLERTQCGLERSTFEQLSEKVDVIVHSAAVVNHLLPFEKIKKVNVDSTVDLIRFACYKKKKCIHYISSLSAAIDTDADGKRLEDFPKMFENIHQLYNGYIQSKWVSEVLLAQAQEGGVAVTIHRLNWVLGHSVSGQFSTDNNHLMAFIQSCLHMGIAPDSEGKIDFFPVDFIVDRLIQVVHENNSVSKVYNYTHPQAISWHNLIQRLAVSQGYVIKWVPYSEWRAQLEQQGPLTPLYKFYTIYLSSDYPYVLTPFSECVDHGNVEGLLTRSNTEYPRMTNDLLNNVFSIHLTKRLKNYPIVTMLHA